MDKMGAGGGPDGLPFSKVIAQFFFREECPETDDRGYFRPDGTSCPAGELVLLDLESRSRKDLIAEAFGARVLLVMSKS